MSALHIVALPQGHVADAALPPFQPRQVLEYQQRIELDGLRSDASDLHQRHMLMVAHGGAVGLYRRQEVAQARRRGARFAREPDAQRQGGDEQADHVVCSGEIRRSAGRGDAEDDVASPRVCREGQRPCSLRKGVERDPVALRRLYQPRRLLPIQRDCLCQGRILVGDGRWNSESGTVQAVQCLLPIGPGSIVVLPRQPSQMVAERTTCDQHGRGGIQKGAIAFQHLVQQQDGAPAVHDQMMSGPDQCPPAFIRADQDQPGERRCVEVEGCGAVVTQQLVESRVPLRLVISAPVE